MNLIQKKISGVLRPPMNSVNEGSSRILLVSLATLMSIGGIVWGSLLVYFRIYGASMIPYGYVVLSILNVQFISSTNLSLARSIQILISMLLPFALQWMLGGYFSSGIVMLWSTLSLVGAITLLRGRDVYPWLIFFIVLTLFSSWIEPLLLPFKPPILTPEVSQILLLINVLMISTIVFVLSKNKTDHDLELNRQLENANSELGRHKDKLELLVKERTEQLEANISLLKVIQEDMKNAKEEAEKANEAKSQFLANMSHEIRSPLNAILGFSQIMSMSAKEANLTDDFKQYLDNIKLSGENLLELINNILDLSKIEAGKIHLSFETINIKQLFKGIFQINKGKAEEKEIHFSYEIDHKVPDFIEGDRTKINQILMNLTSNAIKFTPIGKSVHMKVSREDNTLVFQIIDTGVGIASDRIAYIFDPFEQADNSITRKFGGTGLGLTITKKMTELLQGEIGVESVERAGSTFTIRLPMINSISTAKPSTELSFENLKFNGNLTVIVVEDNEINQQLLKILLKQLGIRVLQAYNGRDGIELIAEHRPDMIIMDIHMPVMDGMEAIRKVREVKAFNHIPIICLTADAFTNQQKKAMTLGANDYLTKPIELGKLTQVFSKYFSQKVPQSLS
jgi:signal transduction histidine kinase/ActR/RegA family two-component response regulator